MLLDILGATLFRNMLAGKGVVRAGYVNKEVKGMLRVGYGSKKKFFYLILLQTFKFKYIIKMKLDLMEFFQEITYLIK